MSSNQKNKTTPKSKVISQTIKLIVPVFAIFFFAMQAEIFATQAQARSQIEIVGSSTVFPFSSVVAELFGRRTNFKTPVVESTGSGGGLKLFCNGVGFGHPDITNASRRIKKSEFDRCQKAGIDMVEVKIGFDGIVIANDRQAPSLKLSLKDVFLAVAGRVPDPNAKCTKTKCRLIENPYKNWQEINPNLPDMRIEVLGPPPTSGTRDAFQELAMEKGAKSIPYFAALRKRDKKAFKAIAHHVREDGVWVDSGENDNLIISKLTTNPIAVGVFGFGFLDQNTDRIKGAVIDKIQPTFENIASQEYNISRSLYFYVKTAHIGMVKGLREFLDFFVREDMIGADGALVDKGLIPLPYEEFNEVKDNAKKLKQLKM